MEAAMDPVQVLPDSHQGVLVRWRSSETRVLRYTVGAGNCAGRRSVSSWCRNGGAYSSVRLMRCHRGGLGTEEALTHSTRVSVNGSCLTIDIPELRATSFPLHRRGTVRLLDRRVVVGTTRWWHRGHLTRINWRKKIFCRVAVVSSIHQQLVRRLDIRLVLGCLFTGCLFTADSHFDIVHRGQH